MSTPEPIAQGDLTQKPFAHLLLYVERKGLSGTLAVWPDPGSPNQSGQDRILFQNGKVVAGAFLTEQTSIDRGMLEVCTRSHAKYAFYKENLLGAGAIQGRVDLLSLVAAHVRGPVRHDVVAAVLGAYGEQKVRLTAGANLARYNFQPKEDAFLQVLRAAPNDVETLKKISGDPVLAERVLYALAITGSLDVYEKPKPKGDSPSVEDRMLRRGQVEEPGPAKRKPRPANPSPGASPGGAGPSFAPSEPPQKEVQKAPPPPATLSDEHKKRWAEIAKKSVAIETQNYFEMLGLPQSAEKKDVGTAYVNMAKIWHPDRLPAGFEEIKPWADRIFHHMTEAKKNLEDDKARQEHLKAIQGGGGTPEADRIVNSIVYSAMEFRKVEVLVQRRNWDEALHILRGAIEMNDQDPDYYAMEAWILYQKHDGEKAPFPKMLSAVDLALKLSEKNEKANFYKALILKRMGKHDKALHYFKRTAEINPRNIDASREVRIAKMRKPESRGKESGIMKLFRKK